MSAESTIIAHRCRVGARRPTSADACTRGSRSFISSTMRSDGLLADAGNRGQPRQIGPLDRPHEFQRLDAREHRERQLRADAADADQPLEQLLLEQRREAEQRECVFADVSVDAERDVAAGLSEAVEGRQRHRDVVADATDVDDDPVGMLLENACRGDARSRRHRRSTCRARTGRAAPERRRLTGCGLAERRTCGWWPTGGANGRRTPSRCECT